MDDLLHPRKKARTELDGLASSNSGQAPPSSSNSSSASSNKQIHSVVYAGYEILAEFSAPYPWDELVKESRSDRTGNDKGNGSNGAGSRGSDQKSKRGSNSRTGKKAQASKMASSVDRAKREDTETKSIDDNDSLSSLSSSTDGDEPPSEKKRSKTSRSSGRKKSAGSVASVDAASSIASFSTFPPPPPSPPLVAQVVKDEEKPPPPLPPLQTESPALQRSASVTMPVKTEVPEQAFQAIMAQDPRIVSRDSSPARVPANETANPDGAPLVPLPFPVASTSEDPANPSPSGSASSTTSVQQSSGGQSVPKPAGTTVEAQKALARQASTAAATQPGSSKALTQREQREIKRKEREAKEKEERERREREGGGKEEERRLWVCERCFKYMIDLPHWKAHQKDCDADQPPGKRVYQRGATSIWEVDGATAKLYCQNLCLFAKLFIEHKYMFFDVESFSFYLLTESLGKQEWVLGYFSKEKVSYDDYNLACIVVFPPFRQKGWATLLIEFSYELSRRLSASPGTPERPLSELGQAGYLSHWTSVLVRYFRSVFQNHVEPPYIEDVIEYARALELEAIENEDGGAGQQQSPPSRRPRKVKPVKGWVGELPVGAGTAILGQYEAFTLRLTQDGEVSGRVDELGEFDFGPSELQVLADKVNLQVEDVAWALVESGLAQWRSGGLVEGGGGGDEMVVITPELVEAVAEKKKVKRRPMLDVAFMCV